MNDLVINRKSYFLLVVAISILLILQIPSPLSFLFDPDQGLLLCNALMIQNGYQPFVDFQTGPYGPLISYLSALFQYFSQSRLIGEIILCFIGYLISYLLLFRILLKLKINTNLSAALILLFVLIMPRYYKYFILLGPALYLNAVLNFMTDKSKIKSIIYLGITNALMGLWRFDYGVYGILVSLFIFFISKKEIKSGKKIIIWLVSAAIIPLCWLLFLVAETDILYAIEINYKIVIGSSEGLSLPFPKFYFTEFINKLNAFFICYWFFFFFPFVALFYFFSTRKSLIKIHAEFIPAMILFSVLIFIQALHRVNPPHLLQVSLIQIPLMAWLLNEILKRNKLRFLISSTLLLTIYVCCLPFSLLNKDSFLRDCLIHHKEEISAYTYSKPELLEYYGTQLKNNKRKWMLDIIRNTNTNTIDEEFVCFLPVMPQGYYFSNRLCAVPTSTFFPGLPDDTGTQELYIESLKKKNVSIIIKVPDFNTENMNGKDISEYFPLFMNYIDSTYSFKSKIGEAEILSKKELKN